MLLLMRRVMMLMMAFLLQAELQRRSLHTRI